MAEQLAQAAPSADPRRVPSSPRALSLLAAPILAPVLLVGLAALLPPLGRAGEEGAPSAAADLEVARAFEARVQATIAQVRSAVVTIGVPDREGGGLRSGGTGVVIDPAGWVLTCDHVTEGRREVWVGLADGRTLSGKVTGRDPVGDVALVKVEGPRLVAAPLGDSEALAVGDPVVALGNPFGLAKDDHEPAATLGIVSGLHRYQGGAKVYPDAIQFDAAVNPGNSGGPLLDLSGRVVGLSGRISIRGMARHNVGVGFAIPAHQIALVLEDLRAGREVARGYLGVRFARHSDGAPGARVEDVVPGSPAAQAGLRVGDRIVAARGRAIDHPVRLQNALTVLPAGTRVALVVDRDGRRLEVEATLGERPQ